MRLSAQNNQFVFNLPKFFIEPWLNEQFEKLMIKNFIPYDDPIDYISSTIKECVIPSMNYENQQQTIKYGKKINWKDSKNVFDTFPGEIDLTFRAVDSYLNYWMLVQIMTEFYLNNLKHNIEHFNLNILDKDGDLIYTILFKEIFLKSISEIRLGYQQYDITERTFTMSFKYNWIDIQWCLTEDKAIPTKSIFDIPINVRPAPKLTDHPNILPFDKNR